MANITSASVRLPQIGDPSGWAGTDDDFVSGYLLPRYIAQVKDDVMNRTNLFQYFGDDDSGNWSGSTLNFPINVRRDNSMHYTTDGGDILTGNHPEPFRGFVDAKYLVGDMCLTDGAVAALVGAGSEVQIINTIGNLMERFTEDFVDSVGREMYLDGDGVIFTILSHDAGGGDGTLMTPVANANGSLYINMDQEVELWNAARTLKRGNFFVVDKNLTTGAVSISATRGGAAAAGVPAALADTDVLVRRGSQAGGGTARVMLGLGQHVDNSGSHEGIDRALVPEWRAYEQAAGGLLTTKLLHDLLQGTRMNAGGGSAGKPDLFLTSPAVAVEYAELLQPTVLSTPGGVALSGATGFQFQSFDMMMTAVLDDLAPLSTIWALKRDTFKFMTKKGLGMRPQHLNESWGSSGGGTMFQADSTKLSYSGQLTLIGEFVCFACRNNGKLTGITVTPPISGSW